jgi:phosphopantetheinyl transferase
VVAKDAILAYARQQGLLLYPQEIVIENNALGAPVVVGNVTRRIPKDWQVSIAHKGKLAAAIVGENAVGIDIEHVDARDEGFMSLAFAPAERVLMQAEPQDIAATRFWVAKEAVAKAGGTGLTGRPQDFIVEARDGNCVRVNGIWVVTHMLHDHVIGWTLNGAAFPRSAEEAPILQRKSS